MLEQISRESGRADKLRENIRESIEGMGKFRISPYHTL